ncbi:MAG TPA: cation diffusion facilitator family transporter [bacterium]
MDKQDPARLIPQTEAFIDNKDDIFFAVMGIARITVIAIVVIAASKLIIGFLINSIALLSEGIHTLLDFGAAIVSYYTVRAASEPADVEHRYGHGKIENAAGIAQAAFIFFPTIIIIYRALTRLLAKDTSIVVEGLDLGAYVMLATMLVNIFLALRLLDMANKSKSEAIRAAAYHQLNDLWTSVGVLIALVLIWWKPHWDILDPIVALGVTLISIWMAWSLFKVSLRNLLDTHAGPEVDEAILMVLEAKKPCVKDYYNLRTRMSGSSVFADIRVVICGNLSFTDGHALTHEIEDAIHAEIPGSDVIIHPDPCSDECSDCPYYNESIQIGNAGVSTD